MKIFTADALRKVATIAIALLLSACLSPGRQTEPLPSPETNAVPAKNITVAVLGATGMVGGFLLQEALAHGYDIRALARTPQKLAAYKDRISIVKGDARDPVAIDQLLRGSDIVISALGPVSADGNAAKMISTTVTGHIIGLMPRHSIKRYIAVSGAAVTVPGDDRNLTGWLMQKMVEITLRETLRDKQAEYQLLADSSIQWTLVRCPLIEAERYLYPPLASLDTPTSFGLRAGELAHFLVEQINSDKFIGKSPFLVSH